MSYTAKRWIMLTVTVVAPPLVILALVLTHALD